MRHADAQGRSGYRLVFHDRVFIVFCLVAVLPVFCIGNFGSIYAVYITSFLGVPSSEWAYLLTLNALIVVAVQIPLVHRPPLPQPHGPARRLQRAARARHRRVGVRRSAVVAGRSSSSS